MDAVDTLARYAGLLALVVNLLIGLVLWGMRGAFAPRSGLEALNTKVAMVEVRLEALPSHDDLRRVYVRIEKMSDTLAAVSRDIGGVSAELHAINRNLALLQEHHLPRGGEK